MKNFNIGGVDDDENSPTLLEQHETGGAFTAPPLHDHDSVSLLQTRAKRDESVNSQLAKGELGTDEHNPLILTEEEVKRSLMAQMASKKRNVLSGILSTARGSVKIPDGNSSTQTTDVINSEVGSLVYSTNAHEMDSSSPSNLDIEGDTESLRSWNATVSGSNNRREGLEISNADYGMEDEESRHDDHEFHQVYVFSQQWFPFSILSLCCTAPILVLLMSVFFDMVGRMWIDLLLAGHLLFNCVSGLSSVMLLSQKQLNRSRRQPCLTSCLTSLSSIVDIALFGWVYPLIFGNVDYIFLTECDGSAVPEYVHYKAVLRLATLGGYFVASLRVLFGVLFWYRRFFPSTRNYYVVTGGFFVWKVRTVETTKSWIRKLWLIASFVAAFLLVWSLFSLVEYFVGFGPPATELGGRYCDPLDTTECMLPFPSYHFMSRSNTSRTGYRVNLHPEVIPPLKARNKFVHANFLNKLDGFPTMGPIMFYINGLKESNEALTQNPNLVNSNVTTLMGPSNIAKSITRESTTLLLDVNAQELVPHSAEIDYLDPENPLVLVFPARPCKHNNHYALAVVGAVNATSGERLPPTRGLKALMAGRSDDHERATRYREVVIPALEQAAPWFSYSSDSQALQLLFDFPTISEHSQLGPVRAVRDATMKLVSEESWEWAEHSRLVSTEEQNCLEEGTHYAKTLNAEIDVPWFLEGFGAGQRASFLDDDAVASGIPTLIGSAKFRVHLPCSVWASTVDDISINEKVKPRDVSGVLEYGHGLFFDRDEATFSFVTRLADEEGYVVIAMDWRGMSAYDLLFVMKTLVARPSMFQAIRDNLIQGYACKLAMQHFARNAMWATDWLDFDYEGRIYRPEKNNPPYAFYGNSQGGILGAGYVALSGVTELIDRAVLGVPGTPFALIMTRSLAFEGYDALLLLNFYNNRHVRMLIALIQMGWDSTEGSGFLAQPVNEPFPPILIQAGLGDATVPTNAAEALARGFDARLLPHHPREIFGLSSASDSVQGKFHSNVTFTEFLFLRELDLLPRTDKFGTETAVHVCLRQDVAAIRQISNFVSNGEVVDICVEKNCVRPLIEC